MYNYHIIRDDDYGNLINEVNRWITKGYQPQGGVAVVSSERFRTKFYQAMLKESTNDKI